MKPTLLALHGITMSGASILRELGPVRPALEAAGFEVAAPDAPRVMAPGEVEAMVRRGAAAYAARGQSAQESFCEGVFWEGERRDWFGGLVDPATGLRRYAALEASLDALRGAAQGRRVVGLLGFSQGCAMAALAAGLARAGELPFGETLRFGVFLAGFKPEFDQPALAPWPVPDLPALFAVGAEDAIFPDPQTLRDLAREFEAPEVHVIPGLAHRVPTSPEWVERITAFAAAHA